MTFSYNLGMPVGSNTSLAVIRFLLYNYMYTTHNQNKKTRGLPGIKIYEGCLGLIK